MEPEKIVDAVQATAEASGKWAELAGRVGAFISKIVGGPAQQTGEMFTDRIRLFKYKNLCSVADKVEAIQRKRKIEGKTIEIPLRLAIPMLESAALEDDETLQGVWLRLIANGTDPQFSQVLHPVFVEIAKQLSADEALILSACSEHTDHRYRFALDTKANSIDVTYHIFAKNEEGLIDSKAENVHRTISQKNVNGFNVYMDNLTRLKIFDSDAIFAVGTYGLTVFGKSFISSCISKKFSL